MPKKINPIRETNSDAINLAISLIADARFAAVSFLLPDTHAPSVSRIALASDPAPFSLISDLSNHTRALQANPNCALLLGEPGPKGDPLVHPRITLHCVAEFLPRTGDAFAQIRARYLERHPKAKLYIDFSDFQFVRFNITSADLNGGFGKAFRLTPQDLALADHMNRT